MSRFIAIFIIFSFANRSLSQSLKPFIGQNSIPKLNDSICQISNYLGSFDDSGYQLGDTVNDFQLYAKDFTSYKLSELLQKGKPVLLISASYTCPIFRGKIPIINQLHSLYKNQLEILVVYTVEAHPDKDISPYFGKVNTGATNIKENILFRQPVLYGDRIKIVEEMLTNNTLEVPVIVDGPCNEWWRYYGPAPNNATLIDLEGIVRIKHSWFDRDPNDIICDIKKYFNPGITCDSIIQGTGQFTFNMISDTILFGQPNDALYAVGKIYNNSTSTVKIEIKRLLNNMPNGWSSSMCLDVCYPTTTDSTQITLKPNQSLDMIVDFFTGPSADEGSVRIGLRNIDDTRNRSTMRAKAITSEITGTKNQEENDLKSIAIYPQPAFSSVSLVSNYYTSYELYDSKGRRCTCGRFSNSIEVDVRDLNPGIYSIKFINPNGISSFKKLILF